MTSHQIKLTGGRTGREMCIEVDGRDISEFVSGAKIEVSVGDVNFVHLTLVATTLDLELEADIRTGRQVVKR